MYKVIAILIILLPMYTLADDNPRDGDDGGKLSDLENAEGGSDNFLVYLMIDIIINSPEVFFGNSTTYSYAEYPYKNNAGLFEEASNKKWHIDGDFSFLKESSSLNALNFDINVHPSRYWSIKGKFARFTERYNFQESELDFTQLFVQYNRIRRERFNLQWGLGFINMSGQNDRSGVGFDLGCELFFYKPLSLDANYVIGFIDDAMFSEFDTKLNLYQDRFNVFVGYKYISVADASLNNLMLGIGLNF